MLKKSCSGGVSGSSAAQSYAAWNDALSQRASCLDVNKNKNMDLLIPWLPDQNGRLWALVVERGLALPMLARSSPFPSALSPSLSLPLCRPLVPELELALILELDSEMACELELELWFESVLEFVLVLELETGMRLKFKLELVLELEM